ncbi:MULTISPECIES: beta-mannanase [unclassified Paenibacillus]|uniref:beta-mannanase n=1 Tax=unclassified Paenibacillus TaxID=185978 RepID=UPI001C108575|nr:MULTISPECIES: beta-mannanase [unclassified Paenibacillus]MBU5441406.1 beta-mannanase [Paenibacillus sp. MSJ-34]CAH0118272.1 hypothetical protein PAE9249_00757 [Paenibacillus sp. CECT 9249]
MRVVESDLSEFYISRLTHTIDDGACVLRWQWPEGVRHVYIDKTHADEAESAEPPHPERLKLYTREEYKANNGYRDRIVSIDRFAYTVYACVYENGELSLVRQEDGRNRITVSTGKIKIYFSIASKTGLFRKYKTIQLQLRSDARIGKEVLCYVKKEGGLPIRKEDGTVYPFVSDFEPGKTVLPPIEVGKDDYIRLFFTDGKKYGQIYELIPE